MMRGLPSQRASFTTSSWWSPFQMTISLACTVRGCSPAAERVRKEGWWVHTRGSAYAGGGNGVENIVPEVSHRQTQMYVPPAPTKRWWPYVGTSRWSYVLKNCLTLG